MDRCLALFEDDDIKLIYKPSSYSGAFINTRLPDGFHVFMPQIVSRNIPVSLPLSFRLWLLILHVGHLDYRKARSCLEAV